MSRVGKAPITIPSGVDVKVEGKTVSVTGPKGNLEVALLDQVKVSVADGIITVERNNDERVARAQHGLMRALIANAVTGVNEGYKKELEVQGVGFKVGLDGKNLKLSLGFSHPIIYEMPEGVEAKVEGRNIIITGISKQLVGQVAAEIRALKKPEPYKGKGIMYAGEQIIRKAGKAAASGGGA